MKIVIFALQKHSAIHQYKESFAHHCSLMVGIILFAAIDGDGMIIALTFVGGGVHLRTRFVASKERLEEQKKRAFLYRGQMGTHPHSALRDTISFLGHLATFRWPKLHYRNPSNTNVFYWGGKVRSAFVVERFEHVLRVCAILHWCQFFCGYLKSVLHANIFLHTR